MNYPVNNYPNPFFDFSRDPSSDDNTITYNGKTVPRSAFTGNIDKQRLDAVQGMSQEDVNKLRALADQYDQSSTSGPLSGVDLSPLMALSDQWTGGNSAKNYVSPQDRQLTSAKLRSLASEDQDKISKEQLSLMLGGEKSDSVLLKALLMGGSMNPLQQARVNAEIQKAADTVHKNKNIVNFSNTSGNLADAYALLARGDVSWNTANEIYQTVAKAISQGSASSDFKLREIKPGLGSEMGGKIKMFLSGNPDEPATPEVQDYLKGMTKRLLDTYEIAMAGEARRSAAGKEKNMIIPEARQALHDAVDYYDNGGQIAEWRKTYNIPPNEMRLNEQAQSVPPGMNPDHWKQMSDRGRYEYLKAKNTQQ